MVRKSKKRILIVDDEEMNLEVLEDGLEQGGYEVVRAEDGSLAWGLLQEDQDFDVVLLDRMMPNMDGMEVLNRMKQSIELSKIPVVMQTAATAPEEIVEGINAGVFYYLTKPFSEDLMLSIVASAIEDRERKRKLRGEVRNQKKTLSLMESGSFEFRNLSDVQNLSYLLANGFPDPEAVVMGISEMLINAVEHGNLGISYEKKKELSISGQLHEEIERRLSLPENSEKLATIEFGKTDDAITLRIKDMGDGFDWEKYMEIDTARVTDPNGRGIATANAFCFDSIEYIGNGNEVVCTVNLNSD